VPEVFLTFSSTWSKNGFRWTAYDLASGSSFRRLGEVVFHERYLRVLAPGRLRVLEPKQVGLFWWVEHLLVEGELVEQERHRVVEGRGSEGERVEDELEMMRRFWKEKAIPRTRAELTAEGLEPCREARTASPRSWAKSLQPRRRAQQAQGPSPPTWRDDGDSHLSPSRLAPAGALHPPGSLPGPAGPPPLWRGAARPRPRRFLRDSLPGPPTRRARSGAPPASRRDSASAGRWAPWCCFEPVHGAHGAARPATPGATPPTRVRRCRTPPRPPGTVAGSPRRDRRHPAPRPCRRR